MTAMETATANAAPTGMKLADLATGTRARVVAVGPPDSHAPADVGRRLAELGFLPGERLRIVARGLFGREPIAVRQWSSSENSVGPESAPLLARRVSVNSRLRRVAASSPMNSLPDSTVRVRTCCKPLPCVDWA